MNWGKWIVLSFVLFAVFIGVLVTICIRQDLNLVSQSYYQDELAFQDRIDQEKNTLELDVKPSLRLDQDYLIVEFNQRNIETGSLTLFRPSDSRLDRKFLLDNGGSQHFKLEDLPHGMYRVKLEWTMNSRKYFLEEIIYR